MNDQEELNKFHKGEQWIKFYVYLLEEREKSLKYKIFWQGKTTEGWVAKYNVSYDSPVKREGLSGIILILN